MNRKIFQKILYLYIANRGLILLTAYLYIQKPNFINYFGIWDWKWFEKIIIYGYDKIPNEIGEANWAFLPFFPYAVKFFSKITTLNYLYSALLLNSIIFFMILLMMYIYVKNRINERVAFTSVLLFCLSPYSFYFFIPYSESIFLFLLLVFFYFINIKQEWLYAGAVSSILSITRNIGVFAVFSLMVSMYEYLKSINKKIIFEKYLEYVLSILLSPLGLFVYMAYLYYLVGDSFAFSHVQAAWAREIGNPILNILNGLFSHNLNYFCFSIISLVALILSLSLLKYKLYSEFIFAFIALLIPLSTGLFSMNRFVAPLFMLYIPVSYFFMNRNIFIKNIILFCLILGIIAITIAWIEKVWFII